MPNRTLLKLSLLLILGSVCLSVSGRSETESIVVVRVNGENIYKSIYERSREYLAKDLARQFTGNKLKEELVKREREVLKTLIDDRVLRQRAGELGISPEAEVIKSLDQMRRDNGLDNVESLEQFLVARGVEPREFKNDLQQQILRARLLSLDTDRRPRSSDQTIGEVPTQEEVNRQLSGPEQKDRLTASNGILQDYIQRLRRASIIEVKHGFTDTGVAYTKDPNTDVLIAARVGDMLKIRMVLAAGANPNAVAANGYSALMHAAEMGHKDLVEALLTAGAQPSAKNHSGDAALLLATVEGYKDIVKVLLANNADANVRDGDDVTPLIYASTNCNTAIVGSLLERNIDVNSGDKTGRTALIAATAEGCSEVVTALLSREADPNLVDNQRRTALTYAVESGRKDLIQALLQKGATVDARDNEGRSAMIYAVIAGRLDLVRQLLVETADINLRDNESQTPLMYAAASGSEQIVQTLLDAGADTKAQTWSLRLIRYDPVGIPIEATEVDPLNLSSGLTAFDIAKRSRHTAIVELLGKAGEKPK